MQAASQKVQLEQNVISALPMSSPIISGTTNTYDQLALKDEFALIFAVFYIFVPEANENTSITFSQFKT